MKYLIFYTTIKQENDIKRNVVGISFPTRMWMNGIRSAASLEEILINITLFAQINIFVNR